MLLQSMITGFFDPLMTMCDEDNLIILNKINKNSVVQSLGKFATCGECPLKFEAMKFIKKLICNLISYWSTAYFFNCGDTFWLESAELKQ